MPFRPALRGGTRIIARRGRRRGGLVALRNARSGGWGLGRGLLVIVGPLFIVVRHTVVVVQVWVIVMRLWLSIAATIIAVRRVVVLAVWLFVLVDRLVAVGQGSWGS